MVSMEEDHLYYVLYDGHLSKIWIHLMVFEQFQNGDSTDSSQSAYSVGNKFY